MQFQERTLMNFRNTLAGGGARSNLFECNIQFPTATGLNKITESDQMKLLVKTAQIPASSIGTINVPFRGRNLKVAGDRTFDPWTVTIINDTDFTVRSAFEKWMNYINRHGDNAGIINPVTYQANMDVMQLSRSSGNNPDTFPNIDVETPGVTKRASTADSYGIMRRYRFYGAYPSDISAIDLSYDSTDDIETFQVTFQYQYWDVVAPGNETPTDQNSVIG